MKKIVLLFLLAMGVCLANTFPQNEYSMGYELMFQNTVNVTQTPTLSTLNYAASSLAVYANNAYANQRYADYVEIYPQTSNVTDMYFSAGIDTNPIVWRNVGSTFTGTNDVRRIDANNVGIDGVVLKKINGSAVAGILWYKRSKIIN